MPPNTVTIDLVLSDFIRSEFVCVGDFVRRLLKLCLNVIFINNDLLLMHTVHAIHDH